MLQQPLRASQGYSAPIPTLQHVESLGLWGGRALATCSHMALFAFPESVWMLFLSLTHVYTHIHTPLCKST